MCQCRFTDCKKCTPLAGVLMMQEAVHTGARGIWKISVPSSQFCCEPKSALRNQFLKIMIIKPLPPLSYLLQRLLSCFAPFLHLQASSRTDQQVLPLLSPIPLTPSHLALAPTTPHTPMTSLCPKPGLTSSLADYTHTFPWPSESFSSLLVQSHIFCIRDVTYRLLQWAHHSQWAPESTGTRQSPFMPLKMVPG